MPLLSSDDLEELFEGVHGVFMIEAMVPLFSQLCHRKVSYDSVVETLVFRGDGGEAYTAFTNNLVQVVWGPRPPPVQPHRFAPRTSTPTLGPANIKCPLCRTPSNLSLMDTLPLALGLAGQCPVCMEKPPERVFVGCGHVAACRGCYEQLLETTIADEAANAPQPAGWGSPLLRMLFNPAESDDDEIIVN